MRPYLVTVQRDSYTNEVIVELDDPSQAAVRVAQLYGPGLTIVKVEEKTW